MLCVLTEYSTPSVHATVFREVFDQSVKFMIRKLSSLVKTHYLLSPSSKTKSPPVVAPESQRAERFPRRETSHSRGLGRLVSTCLGMIHVPAKRVGVNNDEDANDGSFVGGHVDERVLAGAAGERVRSIVAGERIAIGFTDEQIILGSTEVLIDTGTTKDRVFAVADRVDARATKQEIVGGVTRTRRSWRTPR